MVRGRLTFVRTAVLPSTHVSQPRGKARPWINKKKAVTFQVVSRGYSDLLAGDPDAPQNVLEQIPSAADRRHPAATESASEDDDDDSLEFGEEEDSVASDDSAEGDDYDYSQHMKAIGASTGGFSVFVHKNGTVVPSTTVPAAVATDPNRLDPAVLGLATKRKTAAERLGLDKSLFAARSEDAEEAARFSRRFGHIPEEEFVDPHVLKELDDAMQAAEAAEQIDELPDDFVALANAESDDEGIGAEYSDDLHSGDDDSGHELDIDVDDDVPMPRKSTPPSGTGATKGRVVPEHMKDIEEQFHHELSKFDEEEEEEDVDDDADPSQFKGAADIGAFEGMLDEFLEQRSKTYLDGFRTAHSRTGPATGTDELDSSDGEELESPADAEDTEVIIVTADDRYGQDDCESVLSTYSNTENRPRLLDERPNTKIQFTKQGFPVVAGHSERKKDAVQRTAPPTQARAVPPPRKADETPEEKRQRKQTVKNLRRENREKKKQLKVAYKEEEQKQKKLETKSKASVTHF